MSSDNIYYVYIYKDPDSLIPFYVGYGKNGRAYDHLTKAKNNPVPKANQHKLNKIRKLLRENKEPIIEVVASDLLVSVAKQLEIDLIEKFGRLDLGTGSLTNKTKGGEGVCAISDELRQYNITRQQGKCRAFNKEGEFIGYVLTNDPRWETNEIKGNNKGRQYFNDGINQYRLFPEDLKISKLNLVKGRIHGIASKGSKIWMNDGAKSYHLFKDDPWVSTLQKGRLEMQGDLNPKGRPKPK